MSRGGQADGTGYAPAAAAQTYCATSRNQRLVQPGLCPEVRTFHGLRWSETKALQNLKWTGSCQDSSLSIA